MRDSLTSLLSRPLAGGDRRRLAVICVGALLVIAGLLSSVREDYKPSPRASTGSQVVGPTATSSATPDPALEPVPPEESTTHPASRRAIAAAKRAARAFIGGYVPFTFEQGDAAGIPYATDTLRARLAEDPPRVPETVKRPRERPEIELMQVEGSSQRRIGLLAVLRDGGNRFSIQIDLARYESGWLVTSVGG